MKRKMTTPLTIAIFACSFVFTAQAENTQQLFEVTSDIPTVRCSPYPDCVLKIEREPQQTLLQLLIKQLQTPQRILG